MNKQELLNNPLVKEIAEAYRKFQPSWSNKNSTFEQYIESQQPKKEWEILSFSYNYGEIIYYLQTETKGNYKKGCYGSGDSDLNYMLSQEIFTIHSVKRLSDGEIFTIGDRIDVGSNIQIISIFTLHPSNNITVISKGYSVQSSLFLSSLNKAKTPLFTTEDGVEIFEGDKREIWWLPKDILNNYTIYLATEAGLVTRNVGLNYKRLYFSTKQAAEEYVLMNKPCLSINDIFNRNTSGCFLTRKGAALIYLKELVKSKL